MFGFVKKNNYESVFETEDGIYSHLYSERRKTAEILGDKKFIDAWMTSPNQMRVSGVIWREAENGDIPSIKQMVWFSQMMLQHTMQNNGRKINVEAQIDCLKRCLQCCTLGEKFGMNYDYYMMVSHVNLYQIYRGRKGIADHNETSKTLKNSVSYARQIIKEEDLASNRYDDPQGTLQDARDVVERYGVMSQLASKILS